MDKKLLQNCIQKYIRFEISPSLANENDGNFEKLLEFIGEHIDCGKASNISNAYKAIRDKTNALLKVTKFSKYTLKTSKREITAVRQCFSKKVVFIKTNTYLMKIPFKVEYIFKAIITLVAEIKRDKGINIPQSLNAVHSLCYGMAFYKKYIKTYESKYTTFSKEIQESGIYTPDEKCQLALYDSFFADTTPFDIKVGGEVIFNA